MLIMSVCKTHCVDQCHKMVWKIDRNHMELTGSFTKMDGNINDGQFNGAYTLIVNPLLARI